jgi:hypothetical protein
MRWICDLFWCYGLRCAFYEIGSLGGGVQSPGLCGAVRVSCSPLILRALPAVPFPFAVGSLMTVGLRRSEG